MTEQYAEDLYGPAPEGDEDPHANQYPSDLADSPSYAALSTTPPSKGREELGVLLHNAVFTALPTRPTDAEIEDAIATAASVLWGAGYRKVDLA